MDMRPFQEDGSLPISDIVHVHCWKEGMSHQVSCLWLVLCSSSNPTLTTHHKVWTKPQENAHFCRNKLKVEPFKMQTNRSQAFFLRQLMQALEGGFVYLQHSYTSPISTMMTQKICLPATWLFFPPLRFSPFLWGSIYRSIDLRFGALADSLSF